ncbi:hypothetical protein HDV00_007782 [Rhizophlyctis rosea]|nr:hypothetical protein HDV00_007782 [Rhizophlyctis rosea]
MVPHTSVHRILWLLAAILATVSSAASDPFAHLTGNVVVIHGFGGARLVDTGSEGIPTVWNGTLTGKGTFDLPIGVEGGQKDRVRAVGFLQDAPGNPFYTSFLDKLKILEDDGKIKLHLFYFDWRRDNVYTSKLLSSRLDAIRDETKQPSVIFAHSMGSVITLHAIHNHPNPTSVIRGVIFAGGPFNGNIGGLVQQSTPSTTLFPFLVRSTWNYQPFDKRGVIDKTTGQDILLDLYQDSTWINNNFVPLLRNSSLADSFNLSRSQITTYLNKTLALGAQIRDAQYPPNRSPHHYPPLVTICSRSVPTAGTVNATRDASSGVVTLLLSEVNMTPGDGAVGWESCHLRKGIPSAGFVESKNEHMKLLDDFEAVGKAIDIVVSGKGRTGVAF